MNQPMLSIVIPLWNEELSLETLYQELAEVAETQGYSCEMIFVDDGSRDGSWQVVERLAAADSRVRGIRFRRNFGKAAALDAGISQATGDRIMTLDADLQDDAHEIPRFLARIDEGLDLVSGYKQVRHDPWHKVIPSRVFNWMVSRLTGVVLHDHNCGMKCCRREVFDEVRLYGERHRFVPVLAVARGFRVGEMVVHHRPRRFGQSKYGLTRTIKGFLDLLTVFFLTRFGMRPQHLLGSVGLIAVGLGVLGLLGLALQRLLGWAGGTMAPGPSWLPWGLLACSLALLLLGGQWIAMGLVAELVVAAGRSPQRAYSVVQETPPPPAAAGQLPESQPSVDQTPAGT